MTSVSVLFSCLRSTVCGSELEPIEQAVLNSQMSHELYTLSVEHDLAHLVCDALQKNGLLPDDKWGKAFQRQKDLALYRYIQQSGVCEEICRVFEENGVQYVLLKGAVIRDLYPEPWMRTSCDIDILVREGDLERAVSALTVQLNFQMEGKHYHDASLYAPNGVHLELHFQIKESAGALDDVLGRVWEYLEPSALENMCRRMTNEFFLYHHLAHMSYHFVTGGCGLRPFLDCWLLSRQLEWDQSILDGLLEQGGIKRFADYVSALSQKLFGAEGEELSELEEKLLGYILHGGVYGSKENHIRSQQARRGSAARNMMNRIWVPYDTLKSYYTSLDGRKHLLPVYEMKRWLRLVFREKKVRGSIHELRENLTVREDERDEMRRILEDLGLTEQYHDA